MRKSITYSIRSQRGSTLFPYTTLFRSHAEIEAIERRLRCARERACRDDRADVRRRGPVGNDEAFARLHGRQPAFARASSRSRSEEHTSELQSRRDLVCRLLLEKKKQNT